jgi:hypothetical protein
MKIKLITLRKLIYFILTTILFTSCVNHRYKITDLERPRNKETLHLSLFTIGGLVPIFNNLDKDNVCPNSKIRSINLHECDKYYNLYCITFPCLSTHSWNCLRII